MRQFHWKSAASCAAVLLAAFLCLQAHAAYIVSFAQVGSDVVATGNGTLDLTDLSNVATVSAQAAVFSKFGIIETGSASSVFANDYQLISGPTSLSSGGLTDASSGSGEFVGVSGFSNTLRVQTGYVSGTLISDTSTYDSKTLAGLGLTDGTYVWTWGTGADADSFTVQVGPAAGSGGSSAPLPPSAWSGLMALTAMGVFTLRRCGFGFQ